MRFALLTRENRANGALLLPKTTVLRVNCRGSRKFSRVRKTEPLLRPSFPKTITIAIAIKSADDKF